MKARVTKTLVVGANKGAGEQPAASPSNLTARIFVKGLNWVGDAIIATPALAHLRQSFPKAHITLMVRPWVAAVYEHNPHVDDLWVFDETASYGAMYKAIKMVRQGQFQIGVALPNSLRSALLMQLAGIPTRYGYAIGPRKYSLNHPVKLEADVLELHQVYYYLRIVENFCGKVAGKVRLVLQSGELEQEEVKRLLAQQGLDRGRMRIGIAPGSINSQAKRWPAEGFAKVADRLTRAGADVLLLGSGKEQDVLKKVASLCQEPVHNLGGQLSLSQMIALTERLNGLICNDSGAMHIGAAVQIPTVAIFGPTQWTTTYPFSPLATIVRKEGISCAPCMLRDCPIDHKCMTQVAVDDVLEAFKKVLDQARKAKKSE